MRRLIGALYGEQRGSAMLEFAFLCPVLFTILLGIVEMGRMFYVRQSLEYATQQAARYYMVNPAASESNVTSTLRSAMAGGMGSAIGGPDGMTTPKYDNTASCNGNVAVTCTTITATYTFVSVARFLGLGNPLLQAKAQAVRVQQ
jgi:Flp pilus assembly protein TadG